MNNGREALAALAAPNANLGLASGQVELRSHDPQWGRTFEAIEEHLRSVLDDLGAKVEHIGSTAVPGLAAKPILDIAIGAPAPIDTTVYIERLEGCGFTFKGDLGVYGGLFFVAQGTEEQGLAHAHVVDIDDFQWRWYLGFRDALRSDPRLRAEYEQLKQQSADSHPDDRDSYTKAKVDWVLTTVRSLDDAG